jgi:hypothetical protein
LIRTERLLNSLEPLGLEQEQMRTLEQQQVLEPVQEVLQELTLLQ